MQKHAKIAPIRRAYNVVADNPGLSSFVLMLQLQHYSNNFQLTSYWTRSQAVARIADRTAKNCRGHVS